MPQSRALASVTAVARDLNITRGQIEAAIKANELTVIAFPGHRIRYISEEDVRKFRKRWLKKC
jgi:hypothetical protein